MGEPVDNPVHDVEPASAAYPRRFRSAEARGRRIGRPLRVLGRVRGVDEALLARIGRAFSEEDDAGAALAAAMRLPAGDPGRVTHAQLRAALAAPPPDPGLAPVPGRDSEIGPSHPDRSVDGPISVQPTDLSDEAQHPPALRRFLAEVTAVPAWVDWDLVEQGATVQRRLGQNAGDVLLQLSLVGGYRFGGPTDLLVATGALTGGTLRRLAETQEWTVGLSEPGALRPFAPAWRTTLHVRVMHALVSASFAGRPGAGGSGTKGSGTEGSGTAGSGTTGSGTARWDTARWGLPINQADQAATLGLFDGTLILGCRALGVPVPPSDSRALMHLWKWVGHLMGVHPDFLVDDEWARHRLNQHLLLAQAGVSDAGPRLARAVVAAQAERTYRGPAWWQPARAWLERERLLSMLTTFLGVRSMRELGLPLRPPWAHAYLLPLNTWRYRVLGRLPGGPERLERWGRRRSAAIVASHHPPDVSDAQVPRGT
ncbi:oxygenase MpaB family protein [Promicromonospora sp. NPDC059942]|uniref:oxygenase MpaB family protein n=1 Tax=Promicromonospora sp. NPDC059942 TaxID=3347009 RepID=UPI00365FC2EB